MIRLAKSEDIQDYRSYWSRFLLFIIKRALMFLTEKAVNLQMQS